MDQLIKQLQRDFKKNPKKVVLLGGLTAVCLWICAPLVLPKSETKPVKKTPVIAAAAATTPSVASTRAAPAWRWQDLDRALAEDPRMRVAAPPTLSGDDVRRNPFLAAADAFDIAAALDEYLDDVAAENSPETNAAPNKARLDAVPLELSSTLVTDGSRQAVINGRVFRVGDKLTVPSGETLMLTTVEPRRAVVAWQGITRELKILRPGETPQANLAGIGKGL
jgi:hypothetical protein